MSGGVAPAHTDYADWLPDVKTRVLTARQRATLAANAELIQPYSGPLMKSLRTEEQLESELASLRTRRCRDLGTGNE